MIYSQAPHHFIADGIFVELVKVNEQLTNSWQDMAENGSAEKYFQQHFDNP
jgi:hypothetical protein